MAIKEYKYQKATQAQLEKCIRWCQNQFQLRDWEIELSIGATRPPEMNDDSPVTEQAQVVYKVLRKKALIWLNEPVIKEKGFSLYSAVVHEMCHVLVAETFRVENPEDIEDEWLVRILEPILYRLYCKENGLKITPEKLGF